MSAWFTTTEVEERVGGAVSFDFGAENCGEGISRGKVTAWGPPVRVAPGGEAQGMATISF